MDGSQRHPPRRPTLLARLAAHESDEVDVDGLPYRESLQVVRIEGGIANNVVPDACTLVVNRRFAPATRSTRPRPQVEALLDGADRIEVLQRVTGGAAQPRDPLVAEFVDGARRRRRAEARLDRRRRVSRPRGVPALNFGPGDPEFAHTAGEHVTRESIELGYAALARFLGLDG